MAGGPLVVALPFVDEAEIIQRADLAELIARLAIQRECPQMMGRGLLVVAQVQLDVAEIHQRPGLTGQVACPTTQGDGSPEMAGRLPAPALPERCAAEAIQRGAFAGAVARAPGGVASVPVDGESFRVVAAAVKIAEQDGGQAAGMTRPAVIG